MSTEPAAQPRWVAPEAETVAPDEHGRNAALTDAAEERRLVRKVDWILLPVLLSVVGACSSCTDVGSLHRNRFPRLGVLTRAFRLFRSRRQRLGLSGLQYYDKAVLGSAAIFGILKDLHLTTTRVDPTTGEAVVSTLRYSTASSAF